MFAVLTQVPKIIPVTVEQLVMYELIILGSTSRDLDHMIRVPMHWEVGRAGSYWHDMAVVYYSGLD